MRGECWWCDNQVNTACVVVFEVISNDTVGTCWGKASCGHIVRQVVQETVVCQVQK